MIRNFRNWLSVVIISGVIAAFLALFAAGRGFLGGWLAAWGLLLSGLSVGIFLWKWAGAQKALAWMMIVAFLLRIGIGVGLQHLLPVAAYEEERYLAGYIFPDAFVRDSQAWQLAASGEPLWKAFGSTFASDQYGGLLALSAGVYRLFSPDQHRSWLVLLLGALTVSLGMAFFYRTVSRRWGEPSAKLAGWIVTCYPEMVLLGASQMREPFLLGLSAVLFWAASERESSWRARLMAALIGTVGLGMISFRFAIPWIAILVVWVWIEQIAPQLQNKWRWLGTLILAVGGISGIVLGKNWLFEASMWDSILSETSSGWLQIILAGKSDMARVVFLTVYGLVQPVLPATIFDPAPVLLQTISVFRSLGWYLIFPTLLYGVFAFWKCTPRTEKFTRLWLLTALLGWVVLSSLRAGGDMWDNPRYRSQFILLLAVVVAWAWTFARSRHDPWLMRWYGAVGAFVAAFSLWYLDRYTAVELHLPFMLVAAAGVISPLIVLGIGWLSDYRLKKRDSL